MAKKIKAVAPLGAPERVEDCGSQRFAAMQAIRTRRFKRAFPSEEQRLAYLEGRVIKCRRERVIRVKTA